MRCTCGEARGLRHETAPDTKRPNGRRPWRAVILVAFLFAWLVSTAAASETPASQIRAASANAGIVPAGEPSPSGDCEQCHVPQATRIADGPHAGLSCLECHRSHALSESGTVPAGDADACGGCHAADADQRRNHASCGPAYDPVRRSDITCTSSCHDPHGSANPPMLRTLAGTGADELCISCHTEDGDSIPVRD